CGLRVAVHDWLFDVQRTVAPFVTMSSRQVPAALAAFVGVAASNRPEIVVVHVAWRVAFPGIAPVCVDLAENDPFAAIGAARIARWSYMPAPEGVQVSPVAVSTIVRIRRPPGAT